MNKQYDDYLWDRTGEADAEILALESLLASQAWQPGPRRPGASRGRAQRQRRRRPWLMGLATAAAVAMFAVGLQGWYAYRLQWPDDHPWRISSTRGEVTMAGEVVGQDASLAPGAVLETGPGANVRLDVARIGEMVLGGDSRFALVETRDGHHRGRLQHGRLWARVWAPPGAFGVSTPAGDVFDLGCEFLLQANDDGSGSLVVRSGWVQVDNVRREVLVPEGARVEFGAGGEPGIPHDLGASPAFVAALRELHSQARHADPDGALVRELVAASRPQDVISLLYLLQFHPGLARGPVFDRMVELMPADAKVLREDLLARGSDALAPWWNALPYPAIKRWWMQWPDVFTADGDAEALLRERTR